ncbi:MAG TPA: HAMP domain-containing sensor histidine kinase [Gemmataceae bacterium]|nr:HAMP domain-containing sensor histidine kinase [Gemmataceae bacterium]
MRLGIRYRLLVPLGLLMAGVIGASLWSARVAARRAEERVATQMRDLSETIGSATFPLTPAILFTLKNLSAADFVFVQLDGPPLTTFATAAPVPPDEAFAEAADTGLGPAVRVGDVEYRCQRLALKAPHQNAGGVVYIFLPESRREEAVADAQRPSLVGLGFGLVAVVLTFGIGQRLVGRIRALDRRTRLIADGDYGPAPLPRADDELRDLTVSLNEMADRLDRLQQAVRHTERVRLSGQLAAGLAHQLRNGITGAKLALQVHRDEHPHDTEALTVALRQLSAMEANLRRFIDLGRPGPGERQPCSVAGIIGDLVEGFGPRCRHAGVDLVWKPAADVTLDGDPGQLADLFSNLIGNAIEAVGPAGTVTVTLAATDAGAIVEVADTGPGPPPEVAARLFEPFVTGKPEGIGLGLAVARHAAETHGGRLDWRRVAGRTVFQVDLPGTRPRPGN